MNLKQEKYNFNWKLIKMVSANKLNQGFCQNKTKQQKTKTTV